MMKMNRAQQSQIREITVQLTELKNRLSAIHWEIGEDITIKKSLSIKHAEDDLKSAIENLIGVI